MIKKEGGQANTHTVGTVPSCHKTKYENTRVCVQSWWIPAPTFMAILEPRTWRCEASFLFILFVFPHRSSTLPSFLPSPRSLSAGLTWIRRPHSFVLSRTGPVSYLVVSYFSSTHCSSAWSEPYSIIMLVGCGIFRPRAHILVSESHILELPQFWLNLRRKKLYACHSCHAETSLGHSSFDLRVGQRLSFPLRHSHGKQLQVTNTSWSWLTFVHFQVAVAKKWIQSENK